MKVERAGIRKPPPQACWSSEDRAAGHELPVLATGLSAWDACAALQRMEPAILPSSDAKIRRCKACRRLTLRQGVLVMRMRQQRHLNLVSQRLWQQQQHTAPLLRQVACGVCS